MAELTRFRLLRNPAEDCGSSPRLLVPGKGRESGFLNALNAIAGPDADRGDGYADRLAGLVVETRRAGGFEPFEGLTGQAARAVAGWAAWLACHPDGSADDLAKSLVGALREQSLGDLAAVRGLTVAGETGETAVWPQLLALLEDRLLLNLVDASVRALRGGTPVVAPAAAAAVRETLTWLRVARLLDLLLDGRRPPVGSRLEDQLTCPVALPSPPFPLLPAARTAGPPVMADLYVVRDEWSRYIAGELAFIENVMPGEERERATRTTNRTETVLESETVDVSRSRRETYESERTTEAEESSRQTSLEIGLQFNNDLSAKYGAVENNTQIGASLAFSRTDAQRRATEIARESGRRAVVETERQVRRLRRETTETTVRELDAHRVANSSGTAVRGVYRWVEKIKRYQLFTYPHRLQIEFFLPEPGKFLRELLSDRIGAVGQVPVPAPLFLTENGAEEGLAVTPARITPENYRSIGAALGVPDLPAPPDAELVVTESLSVSGGTRDKGVDNYAKMPFPPVAAATKDVQVPDGYKATAWSAAAVAAPELAEWLDHTDLSDKDGDGVDQQVGYHSIVVGVTVGDTNVLIRNRVPEQLPGLAFNTVHLGPADYRDRWLAQNASWLDGQGAVVSEVTFAKPLVGKLSFGATLGGSYAGTVSVTLRCVPTDEAMVRWTTAVYSTFQSAVDVRTAQIAAAVAANRADSSETVRRSLSPSVRGTIVRSELKRQLLDCLLGAQFSGYDDAPDADDAHGVNRPKPDFDQALDHAAVISFFEQSFEWDNLMHVLYPGYWAASTNWSRMVEFDWGDLELTQFLEAGGTRVLAPARPGFEPVVYTFLETGLIFPGGLLIGGDRAPSLSVAQEIMALTRPPRDGVGGDSWESTVPTALLWLDTELDLPIDNPDPVLDPPAED
jgi:hypothetical protein